MITIEFEENKDFQFHSDLHISVPELNIYTDADTYFFADDPGILPAEPSEEKVKAGLFHLLENWIKSVQSLHEGNTAFLPFDFSDQYTGALKVSRRGNELTVQYGWIPEVFSMYPSFLYRVDFNKVKFNYEGPEMEVSIDEFLAEIRRERDKIHLHE
ncbi:hypothetical protein [Larkinella soli]|uniref:hypothetical protein n=1 Tax=Larkinella soli TaxID=1770527 RepID=UPI000FFB1DD6|nr:hypothetical protein [Larkinella soli]